MQGSSFPIHFSKWLSCKDYECEQLYFILSSNNGGLDFSTTIYRTSDCREKDFIERSSVASVSDLCVRELSGGCCD